MSKSAKTLDEIVPRNEGKPGLKSHISTVHLDSDNKYRSYTKDGKRTVLPVEEGGAARTTAITERRVIDVANMISEGKSRKNVLKYIQENFELGERQAKRYYQAALNWLIPENLEEYRDGLIQANIERLETIIQEGIEKSSDARRGADYLRAAKDAIAELNRILGVGNTKIQVGQNKDGDQTVQIEFN